MDKVNPPPPESQAAFDEIRRANSEQPLPEYKRQTGGDGRAGALAENGDAQGDDKDEPAKT